MLWLRVHSFKETISLLVGVSPVFRAAAFDWLSRGIVRTCRDRVLRVIKRLRLPAPLMR